MATAAASSSGSEQKLQSTPSGIPQAPFIEDVESHLGGPDVPVQATLQKFQEALQKYKIMESSTFSRSKSLQEKIPDIEKTLAMVEHLKELREEGKGMETRFELHDTLYASAEIEPVDEVNLWLGVSTAEEEKRYTIGLACSNHSSHRAYCPVAGKCHALLPLGRSHLTPLLETQHSAKVTQVSRIGSGLSERPNHHDGGQHR